MKKPVLAYPLDEKEKGEVFFGTYKSKEDLLRKYISVFVSKNDLGFKMMGVNIRKLLILSVVFALIEALELAILLLYHYPFMYFLLVSNVIALCLFLIFENIRGELFKQVARRPNDNIDQVLISQVSGAKGGVLLRISFFAPLVIVFLIFLGIMWKPHMIFEKREGISENSGQYEIIIGKAEKTEFYALRYYTLSIHPDEHVVVPETYDGLPVREVRGEVFYKMRSLYEIELPSGIKEIRGSTFEECRNLRSIVIPEGVTRIGEKAFYHCESLSEAVIPSTMEQIGRQSFGYCYRLYDIEIPDGTTVHRKAFEGSRTSIQYFERKQE